MTMLPHTGPWSRQKKSTTNSCVDLGLKKDFLFLSFLFFLSQSCSAAEACSVEVLLCYNIVWSTKEVSDIVLLLRSLSNFISMATGLLEVKA